MNMERDKEARTLTAKERVEQYNLEDTTSGESGKKDQHPSLEEEAALDFRPIRKRPLLTEKDQDLKRNDAEPESEGEWMIISFIRYRSRTHRQSPVARPSSLARTLLAWVVQTSRLRVIL